MGLFDRFRRRSRIADIAALGDFLDSRAAFLVQKCVFEYSRARAGILWQKLFKEEAFVAAVDAARWRNYPLGVAHVGRMVEASLRPPDEAEAGRVAAAIAIVARSVIDRHGVPAALAEAEWLGAREDAVGRIAAAALAARPAVKDIPLDTAQRFFDQLPIHPSLRGEDFELVSNNLRSNLCQIHEDFSARADGRALLAALLAGSGGPADRP
ncbi:MAG: hypothetical protein R3D02_04635 [Hyphomicrobiales bacterium]